MEASKEEVSGKDIDEVPERLEDAPEQRREGLQSEVVDGTVMPSLVRLGKPRRGQL